MSLAGIENWKRNDDGTYGPNRWTKKQLHIWALWDMGIRADNIETAIAFGEKKGLYEQNKEE